VRNAWKIDGTWNRLSVVERDFLCSYFWRAIKNIFNQIHTTPIARVSNVQWCIWLQSDNFLVTPLNDIRGNYWTWRQFCHKNDGINFWWSKNLKINIARLPSIGSIVRKLYQTDCFSFSFIATLHKKLFRESCLEEFYLQTTQKWNFGSLKEFLCFDSRHLYSIKF
jgi:hypothetical protein